MSGGSAANASFEAEPGHVDNRVHASNGTTAILREGQSALHPVVCEPTCGPAGVTDAQWSADGTRAVFVNQFNQIETYQENAEWWGPAPAAGTERRSPTFDTTGQYVVWSERAGATEPWHLSIAAASSSYIADVFQWSPDDGFHYTNPDAGSTGKVVYQRNADDGGVPAGTPEVWIADVASGETQPILPDASQPSIWRNSVAFIRSDGTHSQIFTSSADGGNVQQLTTDAADHTNPTWSPDGSQITFNVGGSGVGRVAVSGGAPTVIAGLDGVPTYRWAEFGRTVRLAGQDRFETASRVSQAHYGAGQAQSVVLSRSDLFADALGGSALAAAKGGPLLLTPTSSLNARTAAEIRRVLPTSGTVYLLGGPAVISAQVENAIRAMGYTTIVRLFGADRFETSVRIANEINPDPDLILAATGMNFPDALAAGAAAGSYNTDGWSAVVVLTVDRTLPAATRNYLDARAASLLFPIGGQAAAATDGRANVVVPIVGSTRFETAQIVADVFFPGTPYAGVATGLNWPDALAGGAFMGTFGGPLLLTVGTAADVHPATAWALSDRSAAIHTPVLFGGSPTVTDSQASQITAIVRGGASVVTNPTDLDPPAVSGASAGAAALSTGSAAKKVAAKPRFGTLREVGRR